jgi:hypothetical protein
MRKLFGKTKIHYFYVYYCLFGFKEMENVRVKLLQTASQLSHAQRVRFRHVVLGRIRGKVIFHTFIDVISTHVFTFFAAFP